MKRFSMGALVALVSVAAMAAAGVQEYVLRYVPKAGDVQKYKMSGEMSVGPMNIGMTAVMTNKTAKVLDNGNYEVESAMSEMKLSFDGNTMDEADSPATTTVYRPDGSVVELRGENPEAGRRMANLLSFVASNKSYKVGDSWTNEIKGDSKGSVDASAKYTFETVEKIGDVETAKVVFEAKEKGGEMPASVAGTAWINAKTGVAVKTEMTWSNVPVPSPQGIMPVSGKMTMTLVP